MDALQTKKITWAELNSGLVETFDKVRFDFKNLFTTVSIIQNERDTLKKENISLKLRIVDLENKLNNRNPKKRGKS